MDDENRDRAPVVHAIGSSGALPTSSAASTPSAASTASAGASSPGDVASVLDTIVRIDAMKATLDAWQARLVEDARRLTLATAEPKAASARGWNPDVVARRTLSSELACALRIPERSAETLVEHSRILTTELPETLTALSTGTITLRHARVIVDQSASLPTEAVGDFERRLVPEAATSTPTQFEHRARRLRERLHPESLTARAARSREDRDVTFEPARDQMAWLSAYLPAETATAIYNGITEAAHSLRSGDESRTLAQLRADVFSDLLIEGECSSVPRGIRAKVLVTVPVLTLLGDDHPGTIEGYGPIDAETARVLAANAPSLIRILTHPETGAALSIGRKRYKVPADLRTWLRVRDETCRFPGCRRPAEHCDIDHTIDWRLRGETNHDNLAHVCRPHHQLRHHTPWKVAQPEPGVLVWTSPSGRVYVTRPEQQADAACLPDPPSETGVTARSP